MRYIFTDFIPFRQYPVRGKKPTSFDAALAQQSLVLLRKASPVSGSTNLDS
jgi:hypothetical protein